MQMCPKLDRQSHEFWQRLELAKGAMFCQPENLSPRFAGAKLDSNAGQN